MQLTPGGFVPNACSLLPLLAVAAIGCLYRTDTLRFDQAVRPATIPDSVRVLGQEPTQPHTVVALISVSSGFPWTGGYDRYAWKLAEEAAKLGGQAVLVGPESLS